jgi:hypothetical protein
MSESATVRDTIRDQVWCELSAYYNEGEDTDWQYLTDLCDLVVSMIEEHGPKMTASLSLDERAVALGFRRVLDYDDPSGGVGPLWTTRSEIGEEDFAGPGREFDPTDRSYRSGSEGDSDE